MLRAFAVLPLLIFLTACVDAPESISATARPIVGGDQDSADPAVAYLSFVFGSQGNACSGTLITPRVILTAAHCLDTAGTPTSQTAYFGTTNFLDSSTIESVDIVDSTYLRSWNFQGDDIGLVLLARDAVTTPVPFNRTPLTDNEFGEPLRLVGWGETSPGAGAGTKREVTTTLTNFVNPRILRYGSASANTCQGDSGGPSFMTIDGTEVVVGITSFGIEGCNGFSGATRVAKYTSFIDSWIAEKDVPTPPDTSIVSPHDGEAVPVGFTVRVNAEDNTEVDRVELHINGSLHTTATIAPYIFNSPDLPDGSADIEVRAYDNRDDVSAIDITVDVNGACTTDADCRGTLECDGSFCIATAGRLGDACSDDGECSSGLCGNPGANGVCTQTCEPTGDACPSGFDCIAAGSMNVCWPRETGGCSTSGGSPGGLLAALALSLALVRRRRRG